MLLFDRCDRVLTRDAHGVVFAPHAFGQSMALWVSLLCHVVWCIEKGSSTCTSQEKQAINREGWSAIVLSRRSSTVAIHVRRAALATGSCLASSN